MIGVFVIALLRAAGPAAAPAPAAAAAHGVVVFPFENLSEDRSLYWVSEAVADGLTRELRRSGGEAFERSERLSIVEDLGVPALSAMTLASQIKAAEELGAAALVTGSFRAADGLVTVRARVVDVPAGKSGPWVEVQGSLREIFALQRATYLTVRPALSRTAGVRARTGTGDAAPEDGTPQPAYEYLLKSFFEEAPPKREQLLRRALDLAPDYLRAQVEVAQVYLDSGQADKAAGALSRVVTRDRGLAAQAENLLAEIELQRNHPQAAESALRRSLASQETVRAHLLLARMAVRRADRGLARSELDRARAIDPADPELGEIEEALNGLHQ